MQQYPILHQKLVHLAESQVTELITRYYNGENISALISEYGIDCKPNFFYKVLPPIVSAGSVCPNCGGVMLSPRVSRTTIPADSSNTLRCSKCRHEEIRFCKCTWCRKHSKGRKLSRPGQPSLFLDQFSNSQYGYQEIKVEDLTFELAVSLVALVRCYGLNKVDKRRNNGNWDEATIPFSPLGSSGSVLLKQLNKANLLELSVNFDLDAFSINDGILASKYTAPFQFYMPKDKLLDLVQDIENRAHLNAWPEHWINQFSQFVLFIAFEECKEFYMLCTRQRGLPNSGEHSTTQMLTNLL
jgi:hypothetical protein